MSIQNLRALLAALLLGGLFLAGAAFAQTELELGPHDSTQPIEVTSKQLRLDQENNIAIFTGDVVAVQGAMTLTCDVMEVEYVQNQETGANDIDRVIAIGNVVMVRGTDVAEGEHAVYTVLEGKMVMTENVLVVQDTTVISGDKLTYLVESGKGLMEGNVKTLLVPEGGE